MQSNVGRIEISVPGEGIDKTKKIFEVMKRLGLETEFSEEYEELMYLRQIAWRLGKDPDAASLKGKNVADTISKLKTEISTMYGKPVDKLPDYNPAGQREAFDHGYIVRHLPGVKDNAAYKDFFDDTFFKHQSAKKMPTLIDRVLNAGGKLLANTEKLRTGLPIGGMSPEADIWSGGGNYVYTRIVSKISAGDTTGLVWDADLMRRTDMMSWQGDSLYMGGTKMTKNFIQNHRGTSPSTLRTYKSYSSNESLFKNSLSLFDKLKYIVCKDKEQVEEVIQVFKKHGYNQFPDGRKFTMLLYVWVRH